MFVFQTFKSVQQSPYGQVGTLKELLKQSTNPSNAGELTLQSMNLNNEIAKFLRSYTNKDTGTVEFHLKDGLSELWKSPANYPKAQEVLSAFLDQLKPAEKLLFDNILNCLNNSGFPNTLRDQSIKDGYTKFVAFVLTKHAVAYKDNSGQTEYSQAAFNTVRGATNICAAIKDGDLTSVLPSFGGSNGLVGALSSLFADRSSEKTLKEGIAKSYESYVTYKEYVLQQQANVPLASAGAKKKSEFFV